jgi:hypothetical protein
MAAAKARFWANRALPYFILGIINSESMRLPWRMAAVGFAQVTHLRLCRTRMAAMTGLDAGRGYCLQYSWLMTTGPGSQ